jgi:preprotein translocase subunit YajC
MAMATRPNTDPNAPPPPAWIQAAPIIVMVLIVYMLIFRPQATQRKQRQQMIDSLKKGDKIVTQGGLIATVVNISPTILEVKLNEETKVKIQRSAVAEVLPDQVENNPASLASK